LWNNQFFARTAQEHRPKFREELLSNGNVPGEAFLLLFWQGYRKRSTLDLSFLERLQEQGCREKFHVLFVVQVNMIM